MKFWKRLRWACTLVFIALLVASWLGSDFPSPPSGAGPSSVRPAPRF